MFKIAKRRTLAAGLMLLLVAMTPASPAAAASARQLELAHRYILALHMDKTMDAMMNTLMPQMMAQLPKDPNVTEAQRQMILEVVVEASNKMRAKLMARMEPVIADVWTEQELTDLVAFYEGPTGQSLIAKTPQITARMAPIIGDLMPEMQRDVFTGICAKIDCKGAQKGLEAKPS